MNKDSWVNQAKSGISAGLVAAFVCGPLDVIRTRYQVQNMHTTRKYTNLVQTIKSMIKEEGLFGFYKGFSAVALGTPANWWIYFPIYNELKKHILPHYQILSSMVSACLAGTACSIVLNPIWLARVRMQAQQLSAENQKYRNVFQTLQLVAREEGFRAFYQGLSASLIGQVHVMVQFPLYEYLKRKILYGKQDSNEKPINPPYFQMWLITIVSKFFASLASYPHEVLRSRMQNTNWTKDSNYRGLFSLCSHVYATEGIAGLYAGFGPNLLRITPAAVTTFTVYEKVSYYLSKDN